MAIPRLGIEFFRGDAIGDYVIESELGRGGMGAVYAAVHPIIEKRVAIKILRRELSNNDEAVNRFVQEARAVNRVQHEGIVDVFGYGTTDDGCCFLVMELLEGVSLGRRMRVATLSVPEICDVLTQITHALEAAHARGVIHRDLKPDNVFLVGHERVKLLDFGIAKLTVPTERAPVDYTQPGQAIGTPSYIAPEQARGVGVDGRTDIYSLGVMAFELLTGRLPFDSDNAMELIAHHITMPPPKPSDVAPGLPQVADALVSAMLAKDPAQRPNLARIRELLAELRTLPMTASAIHGARNGADTTEQLLARSRGTRWWIPASVGIALGALGMVGWILLRDRDTTTASAALPIPVPAAVPTVAAPTAPPPHAPAPAPPPAAVIPSAVAAAPAPEPVVETKLEPAPPASNAKPRPIAKAPSRRVQHVPKAAVDLPAPHETPVESKIDKAVEPAPASPPPVTPQATPPRPVDRDGLKAPRIPTNPSTTNP